MATKIITIPDEYIADLVEAYAVKHGYEAEIEVADPEKPGIYTMEPNPQTKGEFMMEIVMQGFKDTYKWYKRKVAVDVAGDAAAVTATTESDNFTGS